MTIDQRVIINALNESVTMLPGSWDKSFVRKLYFSKPNFDLSESQNEWIFRLLYKYRAQLPDLYEKHKNNEFCKQKT